MSDTPQSDREELVNKISGIWEKSGPGEFDRELADFIIREKVEARKTDEYGNPVVVLNLYEAQSVADLIKKVGNSYNTGDWFMDVPMKVTAALTPKTTEPQHVHQWRLVHRSDISTRFKDAPPTRETMIDIVHDPGDSSELWTCPDCGEDRYKYRPPVLPFVFKTTKQEGEIPAADEISDLKPGDILRIHVQGAELIGGGPYYDITLVEKDGKLMADSDSVSDRLAEKWAEDASNIHYVENLRTGERHRPKTTKGDI